MPPLVRATLGWLAVLAILVAVFLALRDRVADVEVAGGFPSAKALAVATMAGLAGNWLLARAWRLVLEIGDRPIDSRTGDWIWSVSQLARYVIGAAQVGGRAAMAARHGLSATSGAISVLVEVGWGTSLVAALMLATVPAWLGQAAQMQGTLWLSVLPVAVLVLTIAAPNLVLRSVARLIAAMPFLRERGRKLAESVAGVRLDRGRAMKLTAIYLVNFAFRIGGFLVLFAAVGGDVAAEGWRVVGAWTLGNVAGRVAVFAPGGLGAQEGAAAFVLAPVLGGMNALALVAADRLCRVVSEALFFGFAWLRRPAAPGSD